MKIKNYKDLNIWKRSIKVVEDIYKITKNFPKEEIYGLSSQLRRSAVSIPSNIAEGAGRNSKKQYIQFLNIALGSIAEIETQLIIAKRLNFYTNDEQLEKLSVIRSKTINLMKYLKSLEK